MKNLALLAAFFVPWLCGDFGYSQESFDVEKLLDYRLSEEELESGWIRLFDGQTLMGWTNSDKADWKVVDSEIRATKGESSLLCTTVPFQNYELHIEFKAAERTNSGVFLRTPIEPKDPSKDCFELNIAPQDNPFPTGSFVGRQKVSEQVAAPKPDEWHTLRARLDGERTQAWLDGQETLQYVDSSKLETGRIGLQFREGAIAFRNIKLRPIGEQLLPGNRDAFRPAVNVQARYDDKGSLTIEGGRGHVESQAEFADGFIQFAAQTLGENVNSGLFFRCVPGEDMNGYECQLHHGFRDSRLQPIDSGTGAIFRRQASRAVLSDEGKKAYVTIVANGPRIATWVQGIQVVDFEDTRKPDANPRRGLRVQAGTLMLQGHDPACRVRFDTIRLGK